MEILWLRFRDGLPVREIARRWQEDPTRVHREHARARREYEKTLREVLGEVHPDGSLSDLLDCLR